MVSGARGLFQLFVIINYIVQYYGNRVATARGEIHPVCPMAGMSVTTPILAAARWVAQDARFGFACQRRIAPCAARQPMYPPGKNGETTWLSVVITSRSSGKSPGRQRGAVIARAQPFIIEMPEKYIPQHPPRRPPARAMRHFDGIGKQGSEDGRRLAAKSERHPPSRSAGKRMGCVARPGWFWISPGFCCV